MDGKYHTYCLKWEGRVIYVGQTKRPKKRFSQHKYDTPRRKAGHPLYDFLKANGFEALQLEVVGSFETREEAMACEQDWIARYRPFGNLTRGGVYDDWDAAQLAKQWREDHPVQAYLQSLRASRIARNKKPRKAKKERAPNRMQSIRRRKRAVRKVWAGRSEEERRAIAKKISESLKRRNAALTAEEKAARDEQLAQARKHINIEERNTKIRESWAKRKQK